METITIRVRSKRSANTIRKLLRTLPDVELESARAKTAQTPSVMDLVGLWSGRKIDTASYRKQAWRKTN